MIDCNLAFVFDSLEISLASSLIIFVYDIFIVRLIVRFGKPILIIVVFSSFWAFQVSCVVFNFEYLELMTLINQFVIGILFVV